MNKFMILSAEPLVSIGVPVRNGGTLLNGALEELAGQTYKNLEIIISDNCSTDQTAALCQAWAVRDQRIKYIRQTAPLTATQNFEFVCKQATGDYFMWAAYDDRHSLNYVEVLVKGAQDHPNASLLFSKAGDFDDHENLKLHILNYEFSTNEKTPFFTKIARLVQRSTHFYGLYPRRVFAGWHWRDTDFAWDQIVLAFVNMRGDFIKVPGAEFHYYRPADRATTKTPEQRAKDNSYRKLRPYAGLRRAWGLVSAACYGEKLNGQRRSRVWNFLRLYIFYVWCPWAKQKLYEISPAFMRAAWVNLKSRTAL